MLSFEAELNKRPIRVKYESDKPTRRVKPDPIDIRADAAFLWWQQHVESTRFDDHKRAILDMEWYGIMHGWFVRNGGFLVPTYTGRKALGLPQLKAAKAAA